MRTLLLLRHAKSDWTDDDEQRDIDRPLNARGRRDAPRMALVLAKRCPAPDLVVCSNAARTRETLELIRAAASIAAPVREEPRIYEAPVERLFEIARGFPDEAKVVLQVGHNPGMERLIKLLTGTTAIVPTATLARIELNIRRWSDLAPGAGTLAHVWRPKELDDE